MMKYNQENYFSYPSDSNVNFELQLDNLSLRYFNLFYYQAAIANTISPISIIMEVMEVKSLFRFSGFMHKEVGRLYQ
jgi:hypothetical protein